MLNKHFLVSGVVQGVGFRPFVYKIAIQEGLKGYVKNTSSGVEIEVQGCIQSIESFEKKLNTQAPVLSLIKEIKSSFVEAGCLYKTFDIEKSQREKSNTTFVSVDIATCKECLEDLKSKRYKNYFGINCTNCGPRYSIIKSLPFDRSNTSMKAFSMCEECKEEYKDPTNRRYHAQATSCKKCGMSLNTSIENTLKAIKDAKIVAIKGIGGFHLVCDATNDGVIKKLREHKNRPSKPFALLCKDISTIKSMAQIDTLEEQLLLSKERPIVLVEKKQNEILSKQVAPNIDKIGCMIAYTPLHALLFNEIDFPLVATSANLASEPIIVDASTLVQKLPFVDLVLDFNRDILNPIDDSVVQVVDKKIQTLRLARGYAPKLLKLPIKSKKNILALGAHQKNSIALCFDENLILSAYIGDLDSLTSLEYFEQTIKHFKELYSFEPELILHDKHPSYESTKWAKKQGIECIEIQHHKAHLYATKAEFGLGNDCLGFSFDGTGFGDDATLWGGEVFVADQRKYHFKPLKLLGGEKALKEPRRVALSLLFEHYSLSEVLDLDLACVKSFSSEQIKLLHQSYVKEINAPKSSSVGRLFDAMASLANGLQKQTYEGEAGLMCESLYEQGFEQSFDYKIVDGVIDPVYDLLDPKLISKFMNTLVNIVVELAKKERLEVILSGGVFQNKVLLELIGSRLEKEGITYHHQQQTPINDGGIALGQIYAYMQSFK